MGEFIRIVVLLVLALIGFASGLCGLFGFAMVVTDSLGGGSNDGFTPVAVLLSSIGVAIAVVSFFIMRAMLRAHARRVAERKAAENAPSAPPGP